MVESSSASVQAKAQLLPKLELIRRIPLFAHLTPVQAQIVADRVFIRRVARGQIVVEQGAKADTLFILLNGEARVVASTGPGREVFLAKFGPGDFFGEMSLIDSEPHSASVHMERTADLLVLDRDGLARCLVQSPGLSFSLMRGLSRRLRGANRQITSLALMDVAGRIARLLLDAAETSDGVTLIRHKVSHTTLAKCVGASREMVGRILRQLEAQGLIATREDGALVIKGSLA